MRRRVPVALPACLVVLLAAAPASALNRKLYVAWDGGLEGCASAVKDFFGCLLQGSDFNHLASQYPNGRSLTLAGTAVVNGCGAQDFPCVVNAAAFPIADGDVVLHYWGGSCVGGTNNWDVFVNGVHIHGADVQGGGSCDCQTALGSHEVYEAAADPAAADCCNGQTQAPLAASCGQFGAPGYGWYKLACPGGTYAAQLLGEAAHEYDPSGCTKLTVGPPPLPPTAQLNGNDAMSFVNWPADGHVEVFATTPAGDLLHAYTTGPGDTWSPFARLDGGARCGAASVFWPPALSYAEVFTPRADGSAAHLWWANNAWNTFQPLGGKGLSHLSTLAWPDGHAEVFALGDDHAIWHDFWDFAKGDWSGWASLGGAFVTAASPIVWGDGHGEIFATDAAGLAWHAFTGAGGWQPWASLGGTFSSRPVPVRWADGHVAIYARGADGQLYASDWDQGAWPTFTALGAGATILGEPSAVVSPAGNGAGAGPELFARDQEGKVVHLRWNGSGYTAWARLLDQVAASEPFGWIRGDGHVEVFAVDLQGALVRSDHDPVKSWQPWASIGGSPGLASCAVAIPSPLADAGPDAAGSGGAGGAIEPPPAGAGGAPAGTGGAGGVAKSGSPASGSGCGCRAGRPELPPPGQALAALAAAALFTCRRRRT